MKSLLPFFLLLSISLSISLSAQINHSQIKKELLALHQQERIFHFEKKAAEFANYLSENIIMVNRGNVRRPAREENESRFNSYFNSVEFLEWDDTDEPIIQISEDGKMAYVVVQKKVTAKHGREEDALQGTTEFAWVSIYEKEDGEWKVVCNASTNKAPVFHSPNASEALDEDGLQVFQALEKFSNAYRDADVAILSEMLTDQYIHSNSGGPIIRKEGWLKWVATRKTAIEGGLLIYEDYQNEDVVVETYSDAAVVHGINIAKGTENGKPFDKRIAFTHTWIKEGSTWKRASFHDSKVTKNGDVTAIRQLNKAYLQHWLDNNEQGVMNLFEEGARISPSSLCPIDSLDNMRQFWFPKDSSTTIVHRFETDEISLKLIDENLACTTQKTFLEWSYKKGNFEMGRIQEGIELTVVRRRADGSWKIWRKMWTDVSIKER